MSVDVVQIVTQRTIQVAGTHSKSTDKGIGFGDMLTHTDHIRGQVRLVAGMKTMKRICDKGLVRGQRERQTQHVELI